MRAPAELLKGSSEVILLAVLKDEPLYGYEIAKRIREQSKEFFAFGEGTLYPLLHKMEEQKLLESYWKEIGGRRRKYYQVTKRGLSELAEKSSAWTQFSSAVNAVIKP
jgi:DNA-binding PadR family transcriptional regulator